MKYVLFSTGPVYGSNPTGGMRRFRELAEFYNKQFDDVTIVGADSPDDVKEHRIRKYITLNPKSNGLLLRYLPPIIALIRSNVKVLKDLKKQNPDRVVIFDVMNTIGPALVGIPNIVLMIRKDLIGYERLRKTGNPLSKGCKLVFQWLCESICMFKARQIICQCIYDREILRHRHPLLSKVIAQKTVIQINNVNPSWIVDKSNEEKNPTLDKTDKFRVCFIGGFDDPRKGQDYLLESAEHILKDSDDVEFVLVGGGDKLNQYKERYARENIIFMGRQKNPIPILRGCDLLVVPSMADSCPNTVMEALYNGIAVIGSREGGIPEILVDEESLFNLNGADISKKILLLKRAPEAMALLKVKQEKRREELRFDWAEIISAIIERG